MKKLSVKKTASEGIAFGTAYLHKEPDLTPSSHRISEEKIEKEAELFGEAKKKVLEELKKLAEKNDIFQAHLMMADDFTLQEGILTKIRTEKMNAQMALSETAQEIAAIFEAMDDEYMRERAADVKDVAKRFMAALKGEKLSDFSDIHTPVILVARDLYPSDTAALDLNYVKGFITEEGGVTSHVSIMAKGAGLPALVGAEGILAAVKEQDKICMDGETGEIVINPDEETEEIFRKKAQEYKERTELYASVSNLSACTIDGREVRICANVGDLEDVKAAAERKADGVGLFRSEFLYMENSHFPTEEEQFEVYKEAAKLCPLELTIRTLDIGGDKGLSYYAFDPEENPFLGWRAIRISLTLKDMFRTQLRAILRASAFGHIRIMFPMIISLEELREAKQLTEECKKELEQEKIPFDREIQMGMMMETPASVLLAEDFAQEADFFSIGTNDLTQYLLAVDRGNKKIASMYNSFHPAVLRAISHVIEAGHKYKIPVGMCGEFASDSKATGILLGMGLDEFSMSSSQIAKIKYKIRNMNYEEEKKKAQTVLGIRTVQETEAFLAEK
ncbi:MAG: phosphoenolpyruvate--protein phosphotransferase [Blautia sp.]